MLLRHVFRPIIGRSFLPIRIKLTENRPEFGVLHMRRNVKMGLGIDSHLLDMGNEQLLVGHENLKSDQDINMVFVLWKYFDAIQHDVQYLSGGHLIIDNLWGDMMLVTKRW